MSNPAEINAVFQLILELSVKIPCYKVTMKQFYDSLFYCILLTSERNAWKLHLTSQLPVAPYIAHLSLIFSE